VFSKNCKLIRLLPAGSLGVWEGQDPAGMASKALPTPTGHGGLEVSARRVSSADSVLPEGVAALLAPALALRTCTQNLNAKT
jgi:hypothetical protein